MMHSNVELNTEKLKVKDAVETLKNACGGLSVEQGARCLSEVETVEARLDDILRSPDAHVRIKELKEDQHGNGLEDIDDII